MRWMVTGAAGALGTDLVRLLRAAPGDDVAAMTRSDLDVTDRDAVHAAVEHRLGGPYAVGEPRPVLLNAAAHTAVDLAETDPDQARAAAAVNGAAPGHLAEACARVGARLVHVSTDYVFAGDAAGPYEPDDPTGPSSVYGRSKLDGERRVADRLPEHHHVVRTAWVYGDVGTNFVRTMARLAGSVSAHPWIDVVDDQRGSPTWSADLAAGLLALGRSAPPAGTLHATGGGATTWFEVARAVFVEAGQDPSRVRPCTTDRFPRPARRPPNSVLADTSWRAAGLPPLPAWRAALSAAVARHPDLLTPAAR